LPDYGYSKDALRAIVGLSGEFVGTTDVQVLEGKTYNTTDNTLTATSQAAGDILVNNATKFVRLAKGTANQALKMNSAGTTLDYGTLPVAGGGTGVATLAAGVVIANGTGAFTQKTNPTGAFLGDSDTQNVAGAKTFSNTALLLRNPANTFSMTVQNPAITSAQEYRFNSAYSYYIFKSGSTFYAKSGITKGIEFSGTVADVVIQAAVTAVLASSRGGIIQFSADDFPLNTPIDIPTATVSSAKPIIFKGVPTQSRVFGTVFSASASFPTGRYFIETSGATDLSNKSACIVIKDMACYNINFATLDAGFIKYDVDNNTPRQIIIDGLYAQYMWRGIHLIGCVWWGIFKNIHFEDVNNTFVGDADIILEQGAHTNAANNPWPKVNAFKDILVVHSGTVAAGSMVTSLKAIDSGYNHFDNYWVDSNCTFSEAVFSFTGKATYNRMTNCGVLDTNTVPSPDNRKGAIYLSGTNCTDNRFENMRVTDYKYMLAIKSGAYRNEIELAGFWGANLDIDDTGAGVDNVVKIYSGALAAATPFSKPTTTAALVKIIDNRKGAYNTGVSTQSGNATTTAFNIAHGLFTTPLNYSVTPQTNDAVGPPTVTATSTNIVVTYPVAPPTGSSNLVWVWSAGVY
jgi:hypothetical protein